MHKVVPLLAIFLLACSTARITRTDGSVVEGSIDSSDTTHLNVSTSQGKERVARSDVQEIEHPGGGPITFGAVTFGLGVASAGGAAYILTTSNDTTTSIGAIPFLLGALALIPTGALVGSVGLFSRWGSEDRAKARSSASLSPFILDNEGRAHPGVGVSWSF